MKMPDRPCMNDKCVEKLIELIRPATTVLEWGSGGSTVLMSKEIKSGTIYSYEHDRVFYDVVKKHVGKNVKYHFVSLKDYVTAPPNIHYSVILVDGRERNACLRRARDEMSWNVLLLHDARRKRYQKAMHKFCKTEYKISFVKNLWVCERK